MLSAFDEQVRRHPEGDGRVEHDRGVIRCVSDAGGWNGVTWSDLDDGSADAVIAAQVSRFSTPWEWKHYSYDQPPDLPDRLVAAGFTREPAETLLVAEIADLELDVPPPAGVELRAVVDQQGVDAVVAVHDEVFGEDHSASARCWRAASRSAPVASRAGRRGRGDPDRGRPGAVPSRPRLRRPVGRRHAARVARPRRVPRARRPPGRAGVRPRLPLPPGRRLPESRPILERLGFVELATTTPFVHPG